MKKIKLLLVGILLLPLFIINVNAASVPYQWIVGGETVNVDSPNKEGTATLEKDGKTVTLSLGNYVGGKLTLECYGTGQSDVTFIIDLAGNNVITSDDIGIDFKAGNDKIKFTGNGNLTINAPTPISYESFSNRVYIDPTNNKYEEVKEETKTQTTTEETTKEEQEEVTENTQEENELIATKDDTTTVGEEKDNNIIILISVIIFVVISITALIIVIVKANQKNKEISEN